MHSFSKVRPAAPADVPQIRAFIHELAQYEKLEHELATSERDLSEHLFGARPLCEALLAEERTPVGFALYYPTYSTFKTNACLHLEDLYVTPAARGRGHGKALLHALGEIAMTRGMARVTWNVLDWNEPAIRFYEALGATVLPDWRVARVEGAQIETLVARSRA
jgi:GNAT superfamily N-acetyltransferase